MVQLFLGRILEENIDVSKKFSKLENKDSFKITPQIILHQKALLNITFHKNI